MSADLRERIEMLEEENRQLKALLSPPMIFPSSWKLSPQEARLLAALYAHVGFVAPERLRVAIVGVDGEQGNRYHQVVLVRLRQKVEPLGVTFVTKYCIGVCLLPEGRVIVQDALAAVAAGTVA